MPTEGLSGTLRENIAALAERERAMRARAPLGERVAGQIARFAGSITLVWIHSAVFGIWIVVNLGWIAGVKPFDPTFVGLATLASVEAIFLTTFVLIGQNRMAVLDDRRAELDLHISLLTEHELTRIAVLVDGIAQKLGVPVDRREFAEVEQDVQAVDVLEAIDENKAKEGE